MLRWLGCLAAAIPSLLLAAQLLRVWVDPSVPSAEVWIRFAGGLLVLEFAALFAAGLLGDPARRAGNGPARWLAGLALVAVQALLLWGCAMGSGSPAILPLFGALVVGRMVAWASSVGEAHVGMAPRAAVAAISALPLAAFALLLPWPAFGLTPGVLATIDPSWSEGAFAVSPRRVLVFAIAHFALMGLVEIFVFAPARNAGVVAPPVAGADPVAVSAQPEPDPARAISSSLGPSAAPAVGLSEK